MAVDVTRHVDQSLFAMARFLPRHCSITQPDYESCRPENSRAIRPNNVRENFPARAAENDAAELLQTFPSVSAVYRKHQKAITLQTLASGGAGDIRTRSPVQQIVFERLGEFRANVRN